jgi:hypothetical protein
MLELLPETAIVKLPTIGLATGVIDVLDIDKDSDFFQQQHLQQATQKSGL